MGLEKEECMGRALKNDVSGNLELWIYMIEVLNPVQIVVYKYYIVSS